MSLTDNLMRMILQQKETLTALEEEVRGIAQNDFMKENASLKEELQEVKEKSLQAQHALKGLKDENGALKNALYEQIYNEKIKILQGTTNKMDLYFKANYEGEQNRLMQLEQSVRTRIDQMVAVLRDNRIDAEDEIYRKVDELSILLNEKVTMARTEFAKTTGVFSENEKQELEALRGERITDSTIKQVAKKNNIESFIGLNLINKLGIFFIIIGVIAVSQLTYMQMSDILKGILMFSLGAVMLVAGEVMSRKNANIFSLGITSGGVAVLYVALSVSYFGLKILDMYPAIALCVLITGGAFVLSQRYHSQTIAAFALIGGYLPIFSITGDFAMVYGAMIYFVVLNLLALMVSFHKKWLVATYIGFFFNAAGTIYITINMTNHIYRNSFGIHHVLTILYILFAFVIYTLIPIMGTYMEKLKFKKADVILMGINTFISSITLYGVFYTFGLRDFDGLLAVVFALIYLGIGWLVDKKFKNEKHTKALFYLTGLAFVVLIIPFQFGKMWLTLGWLAEGVLLTSYGILTNEKSFKRYGFIINSLCLFSFLCFDFSYGHLFPYKYLAVTLGSLIILSAYIYKRALFGNYVNLYKYATIINLWFYSLYLIFKIPALLNRTLFNTFDSGYIRESLAIAATLLIACIAPRVKILSDKGIKIISMCLYGFGILWMFFLNSNAPLIHVTTKVPISLILLGTLFLLIMGMLSLFALHDFVKYLVMERKLGVEWYPLLVSFYFVLILSQNLITQYHIAFISASISIIYVLTALFWIVFGFMRRYALMRRYGLGLSFLAVAKLFILDLSNLTKGYQIISYFAFGLALIAISLVYQYFNKRLELKGTVISDVEEDM